MDALPGPIEVVTFPPPELVSRWRVGTGVAEPTGVDGPATAATTAAIAARDEVTFTRVAHLRF